VAAAALIVAAARGRAAAFIGLIVLAAVDLGWYGMTSPVYSKSGEYTVSYKVDPDAALLAQTPFHAPASKQGSVAVTVCKPGRWEVDLNGIAPQLLVVNEPYRLGWRATVDGLPREIHRVNGEAMGCTVEPGKHKIVLSYRPESLARGRFASFLGLGLLSLCFLGCIIRPKRLPWHEEAE